MILVILTCFLNDSHMVNISDIPLYTPGTWLYHAVIVILAVSQRVDTQQKEKSANRIDLEITTCLFEKNYNTSAFSLIHFVFNS